MLILGIDTSAVSASAAVCETGENARVLCEACTNTHLTHSETLMPMIENMLGCARIQLSDIELFAVASGPGSFTGLRISVSAVKGMAVALNRRVVGVSTLSALSLNAADFNGIICPAMDARCNQVYNALFRCNNGKIERLTDDRALFIPELSEDLKKYENEPIMLIGDGAELAYRTINGESIRLATPRQRLQSAASVCFAAEGIEAVDPARLMPGYLRLPQAERERLARERDAEKKEN